MKGKTGKYPVECKTKDTVVRAARKHGGRTTGFSGNLSDHSSKEIGALAEGGSSKKHAGKSSRGVHGKPLMSEAAGKGTQKGHKSDPQG